MQLETRCPGCGRTLRVPAEHTGKTARCPVCSTLYTVPQSDRPVSAQPGSANAWYLKTPEGQSYGPVPRDVLDRWVAEGRVSDECRLLHEGDGLWVGAAEVYPALRPVPQTIPAQPAFDNPVAGTPQAPRPTDPPSGVRIVNAHRGGLVLALGILSWAIGCAVFGIMAWIMGTNDLRDMERGAMDRSGMGLTQAGQIIGMIHALLSLVGLVFLLFAALLFGVFR
jgi:hypothetical protein